LLIGNHKTLNGNFIIATIFDYFAFTSTMLSDHAKAAFIHQ